MKDCQLPLDALPGEIVDRTRTRTPGVISKSPEASSLSRQPAQLPEASPATWSLSRLKPAQEPEPLPATRTTATDSLSACPAALSHRRWVCQPPQPAPAARTSASPAILQREPSSRSFPSPASRPAVPLEASLRCHPALPARSPHPATVEVSLSHCQAQLNPDVLSCIFVLVECLPPSSVILFSVNFHS